MAATRAAMTVFLREFVEPHYLAPLHLVRVLAGDDSEVYIARKEDGP